MISKTSFRNWVVYKGVLKRLKWLSILFGVVLFLEMPLLTWIMLSKQKAHMAEKFWAEALNKSDLLNMMFNPLEQLVNIIVPIAFGLIIFQYLQQDRASSFFHSLPLKRWSLYWQNLLAGLTLIWLPILINGLLVYGVFSYFGVETGQWQSPYAYGQIDELIPSKLPSLVPVGQVIFFWLFLNCLMTGLFYSFTVFVGMFTGNILLQAALTFTGLFWPLGIYLLTRFNLWKMLYGFPRDIDNQTLEWLSPVVSFVNNQNHLFMFKELTGYLWYFGFTVLLCGLSIYFYRVRNTEAAGETLAAGWIRWVFKYGGAVCAALTGGLYFSSINEESKGLLYLGYFVGAVLGYVIADMIAYKSFHFYKRWKGMLVFGFVFILLLGIIKLDLYGYEKYVPEQADVKEVLLSNLNRDGSVAAAGMTSQENIQRVRLLHQQIIAREQENIDVERARNKLATVNITGPGNSLDLFMPLEITYVLDKGSKVKRSYQIDVKRYRSYLQPIFNSEEAKRAMYARLLKIDQGKVDQININNFRLAKNIRIYKREEVKEALAALKKDVLNITYEAIVEGRVPAQASIEFMSKLDMNNNYSFYNLSYYPEYKNLEAFLIKQGYQEDLFIQPKTISKVILQRAGQAKVVEVTDQQQIVLLLSWSVIDEEQAYLQRQQEMGMEMLQFSGKIVKKDGSQIFVMLDYAPYSAEMLEKLLPDQKESKK